MFAHRSLARKVASAPRQLQHLQHLQQQQPQFLASIQIPYRSYATPAQAKVAKFNGVKGSDGKYTVTLIEGDGIGPEISQSVKDIFAAAKVHQFCLSKQP